MATILVSDGDERAALAIVRSLGKAGHRVHVGSTRRRSLAGASRHAIATHRLPDPLDAPAAYARALLRTVHALRIEIVIPVTDPSILAVLEHRSDCDGIIVPFPELERYRRISDKRILLAEAAALGIAVPPQLVLMARGEAAQELPAHLSFPLVLKPVRSVAGGDAARGSVPGVPMEEAATAGAGAMVFGGARTPAAVGPGGSVGDGAEETAPPDAALRIRLRVRHAGGRGELRHHLDSFPDAAFPVLLQERINGPGEGVFLLIHDGRLLAHFSHRRIREKPPSGGVSVLRESIPTDPALLEASLRLLERFDWSGVAMVEFKRDAETGVPYLMEVNGRFWGSLQLAIDAGVDFPALLVAAATGLAPEPVRDYRIGARSRWLWGDVDQLLARMRKSRSELALPADDPGRARAAAEFLRSPRPKVRSGGARDRFEVLRPGDPLPFVRESLDWLRRR
jgi:predicted ATP-grasp superfamily ATP-dependent carboligase